MNNKFNLYLYLQILRRGRSSASMEWGPILQLYIFLKPVNLCKTFEKRFKHYNSYINLQNLKNITAFLIGGNKALEEGAKKYRYNIFVYHQLPKVFTTHCVSFPITKNDSL